MAKLNKEYRIMVSDSMEVQTVAEYFNDFEGGEANLEYFKMVYDDAEYNTLEEAEKGLLSFFEYFQKNDVCKAYANYIIVPFYTLVND